MSKDNKSISEADAKYYWKVNTRVAGDKEIMKKYEVPIRLSETMKTDPLLDANGNKAQLLKVNVIKDRNLGDTRTNTIEKSFKVIKTLRGSGVDFIWNYELALSQSIEKDKGQNEYLTQKWTNINTFLGEKAQKTLLTLLIKAAQRLDEDNDVYATSSISAILEMMVDSNQIEEFDQLATFAFYRLLWTNPMDAHEREMNYSKNRIMKPYGVSLEEFSENMRILADWLKYLPPPHDNPAADPMDSNQVNWDITKTPIPEDTIRKAIVNALPMTIKDEVSRCSQPDGWLSNKLESEDFENLLRHLQTMDDNTQSERAKAAEAAKARKESQPRNGGKDQSNKRKSETREDENPRKKRKPCETCFKEKRSEKIYMSHTTDKCKFKDGTYSDRRTESSRDTKDNQKWNKKQIHNLKKELKEMKKIFEASKDPNIRRMCKAKKKDNDSD